MTPSLKMKKINMIFAMTLILHIPGIALAADDADCAKVEKNDKIVDKMNIRREKNINALLSKLGVAMPLNSQHAIQGVHITAGLVFKEIGDFFCAQEPSLETDCVFSVYDKKHKDRINQLKGAEGNRMTVKIRYAKSPFEAKNKLVGSFFISSRPVDMIMDSYSVAKDGPGDLCIVSKGTASPMQVCFTRGNVAVEIETLNNEPALDGNGKEINLIAFGKALDQEIQKQAKEANLSIRSVAIVQALKVEVKKPPEAEPTTQKIALEGIEKLTIQSQEGPFYEGIKSQCSLLLRDDKRERLLPTATGTIYYADSSEHAQLAMFMDLAMNALPVEMLIKSYGINQKGPGDLCISSLRFEPPLPGKFVPDQSRLHFVRGNVAVSLQGRANLDLLAKKIDQQIQEELKKKKDMQGPQARPKK